MEFSISGPGLRTTLNCYMQASMRAISAIAGLAGKNDVQEVYSIKADRLEALIQERLWDENAGFYRCIPLDSRNDSVENWSFDKMDQNKVVREIWGYIPWYFGLAGKGRDDAWRELFLNDGFHAEYSPSVAERRHPMYGVFYTGKELFNWLKSRDESVTWMQMDERGHECLWNGPSWPLATSQALTALSNYLQSNDKLVVSEQEYFDVFSRYAKSHRRTREDGVVLPWIDENQHPDTGDWIARTRLAVWKNGDWDPGKGGIERGKDYNHSTFCDLLISGLFGVQPDSNGVDIKPLLSGSDWDYACLDAIPCHNRLLTILYDRDGTRYNKGKGFRIFVDGKLEACHDEPVSCRIELD
jgi:hypothetical protein